MASTSSPYGLIPIGDATGTVRTQRIPNGISQSYGANIFTNQPVKINPTYGTIEAVTATTDKIFGVFMGVYYTPPGGQPTPSAIWPSGGTYSTTDDMFVWVVPAWVPGMRFQIQADGTVAQALLGSQFNLSNFAAGSTLVGLSNCTAAFAGVAGASQGQLVLEEFYPGVNSAIGDAYTDLIVGVSYPQIVGGFQTSIG
jgi:hypothetical protein